MSNCPDGRCGRRPQPNLAALTAQCEAFNNSVSIGSSVKVLKDDRTELLTKTRSAAWVMGGHAAMIMVDGIAGGYLLERVKPV